MKTCLRFLTLALIIAVLKGQVMAADPGAAPVNTDNNGVPTTQSLLSSIDSAIRTERDGLSNLIQERTRAKEKENSVNSDIYSLKVQLSITSNILIIPESGIKSMEQAYAGNLAVLKTIGAQIEDLKGKRDRIKVLMAQTDEQVALNSRQLHEISQNRVSGSDSQILVDKLKTLIGILGEKKKAITELDRMYESFYTGYADLETQFSQLSGKFEQEISTRRKQDLFQRKDNALFKKTPAQIRSDMVSLIKGFFSLVTLDRWVAELGLNQTPDYQTLSLISLLFAAAMILLYRLHNAVKRLGDHPFSVTSKWVRITLDMAKKSVFLTGIVVFIEVCDHFTHMNLKIPVIAVLKNSLVTFLITQWFIDILCDCAADDKPILAPGTLSRLTNLSLLIRYVALIYIVVQWTGGDDNVILSIGRIVFAIYAYAWLYRFRIKMDENYAENLSRPRLTRVFSILPIIGYLVVFVLVLVDLAGYSRFAVFLFLGSWKTMAIFLWSALILRSLLDIKAHHAAMVKDHPKDPLSPAATGRWFLVQLYMVLWFVLTLTGVFYIWGGRQAVVAGVYTAYTTPVNIGNMSISLMSLTIAIALIFLTRTVTRVFKEFFQKKILRESGMDIGVQESITTISVYLIWAAGTLLALNILGVNMTSITVVLGALGIGLGFGLQNIFNNFLSGIILLFERPIQVGDEVEINGTWATVRKINVRSTVVQTYDNATLIIPNSDLISSQVTNWSFKDRRLRRNISVGVAYGSDLTHVKNSLIEAAEITPKVLKTPKPDVVFKDFGDNALLFVLRFWTSVDGFLAVETAVRFEIDRLFRERGIEISYPQMDLHVKTLVQPVAHAPIPANVDDPPPK